METQPINTDIDKRIEKLIEHDPWEEIGFQRPLGSFWYGLSIGVFSSVISLFFISYILSAAIRRGRTAYYTTLPRLEYDMKRGWKSSEVEERLDWMLTSDFVAIDEIGKEKIKGGSDYTSVRIEHILKQRYDDSMPVLLASNMSHADLTKTYGDTIGSIITGKYQTVAMDSGDYRKKLSEKMVADMDYV